MKRLDEALYLAGLKENGYVSRNMTKREYDSIWRNLNDVRRGLDEVINDWEHRQANPVMTMEDIKEFQKLLADFVYKLEVSSEDLTVGGDDRFNYA